MFFSQRQWKRLWISESSENWTSHSSCVNTVLYASNYIRTDSCTLRRLWYFYPHIYIHRWSFNQVCVHIWINTLNVWRMLHVQIASLKLFMSVRYPGANSLHIHYRFHSYDIWSDFGPLCCSNDYSNCDLNLRNRIQNTGIKHRIKASFLPNRQSRRITLNKSIIYVVKIDIFN